VPAAPGRGTADVTFGQEKRVGVLFFGNLGEQAQKIERDNSSGMSRSGLT